jgi:hypothetical protein
MADDEILVERMATVKCLEKLIELTREAIQRLEDSGDSDTLVIRDAAMAEWAREERSKKLILDPSPRWVCDHCQVQIVASSDPRRRVVERLTHLLKVIDEQAP